MVCGPCHFGRITVQRISSTRPGEGAGRVLEDNELARILSAARQMTGPYGGVVELLALTGQRREEVANLTWDEVDLASRTWRLPASRTKNGKPHIVHLSNEAVAVLNRTPATGDFIFSLSGTKAFQSFSAAKRELTRSLVSWSGSSMICAAHVYRAWPGLVFLRMSLTRCSTTRAGRFLGSPSAGYDCTGTGHGVHSYPSPIGLS